MNRLLFGVAGIDSSSGISLRKLIYNRRRYVLLDADDILGLLYIVSCLVRMERKLNYNRGRYVLIDADDILG